jgi:hypothetical protein
VNYGSVGVLPTTGHGVRGYGYGVGKSYPRYTRAEPYPVRKASSDAETNRAGSDCDTWIVAHRMRLLEIDRFLSNEIKFRSILESDSRSIHATSKIQVEAYVILDQYPKLRREISLSPLFLPTTTTPPSRRTLFTFLCGKVCAHCMVSNLTILSHSYLTTLL